MNKIIDNFYHGYNKSVALAPKLLVIALILFVAIYPDSADKIIGGTNWSIGYLVAGTYTYLFMSYVV